MHTLHDLTSCMMGVILKISNTWIFSDHVNSLLNNTTSSFAESMMEIEELIYSSHRAMSFLVSSGPKLSMGSYGVKMGMRQQKHRIAMINSVRQSHDHLSELRQVPPHNGPYEDYDMTFPDSECDTDQEEYVTVQHSDGPYSPTDSPYESPAPPPSPVLDTVTDDYASDKSFHLLTDLPSISEYVSPLSEDTPVPTEVQYEPVPPPPPPPGFPPLHLPEKNQHVKFVESIASPSNTLPSSHDVKKENHDLTKKLNEHDSLYETNKKNPLATSTDVSMIETFIPLSTLKAVDRVIFTHEPVIHTMSPQSTSWSTLVSSSPSISSQPDKSTYVQSSTFVDSNIYAPTRSPNPPPIPVYSHAVHHVPLYQELMKTTSPATVMETETTTAEFNTRY